MSDVTVLDEFYDLQAQLIEKANIFLAYFGLSQEVTFAQLNQVYKALPNSLSIGILVELPDEENTDKEDNISEIS